MIIIQQMVSGVRLSSFPLVLSKRYHDCMLDISNKVRDAITLLNANHYSCWEIAVFRTVQAHLISLEQ
jgi:hypothetical protein